MSVITRDLQEAIDTSLNNFLDRGLISEVLYMVRSGKEAIVYCCRGGPLVDAELVALKVYKPLEERSFRNEATYNAGRVILDRRVRRAVQKKTRFGQRAHLGIWAISEYETLQALSAAGADVPRPIAHSSDAVLMDYIGDAGDPAPTLNRVDLDHQSAIELFQQLIANIELFVRCDRVHGDLSPYNVLYWQGGVKIIDFPQASDPRFNPNSRMLLERDLVNICNHFRKFGVEADPGRIVNRMWSSYKRARL